MDYDAAVHQIETIDPIFLQNLLEKSPEATKGHHDLINALKAKKLQNDSLLKGYIIDSSENIIQIFFEIASIKDELHQTKRNFNSVSNQMVILKKKYIEPFDKLIRSISTKSNVDNVITLHNNIKSFKADIKILRNHFDKNTLTISESNYATYIKAKSYQLAQFIGITVIKEDLDWFTSKDYDIQAKFRAKFEEAILAKDTKTILLFFNFYSQLETLVTEVKNFANKVLNDLIKVNLFNKIIKGIINPISPLDMIYENVLKLRKELSDFFSSLESYSMIFVHLGKLLNTNYDKKHFILFETIMETEDLQDINACFIKSVFTSLGQIFKTISSNQKNSNSNSYFIKDYIFLYFSIKKFIHLTCQNESTYSIVSPFFNCCDNIKGDFLLKYKTNITENIIRAFTLVNNIEQNADTNLQFEKENIVNVHIIEHLVDYIKKLSQSFTDLYDDFAYVNVNENMDSDFYSAKDELIAELQMIFTEAILDNYFMMIFSKLENVLNILSSGSSSNEVLLVQKFYYFYYILYKMNDVFVSFINSNVSYLISDNVVTVLNNKMDHYMNQFYSVILNRFSLKILLVNRDDFQYYVDFIGNLMKGIKLFFAKEHYNNNRAFEKPIMKYIMYLYSLASVLILMLNCKIDFECYDELLNDLTEVFGLFFKLNRVDCVIQFHESIKMLSQMIDIKDKRNYRPMKGNSSKGKQMLYALKLFSLDDNAMVKFLSTKKINMELFSKYAAVHVAQLFKVNLRDLPIGDNQVTMLKDIDDYLNDLYQQDQDQDK